MIKEVQHLAGRIAALNQFVSKSVECYLPFFRTLRQSKNFQWMDECQKAFANLKSYLSSAPLLDKLDLDEELFLYLSISPTVMSTVLVQEQDGVQKLIYYISQTLRNTETCYSKLEKLAYALLITARKLRPYFQAHSIILPTNQPLRSIFHRPNMLG